MTKILLNRITLRPTVGDRLLAPCWAVLGSPQRWDWELEAGRFLRGCHVPLPDRFHVMVAFSAFSAVFLVPSRTSKMALPEANS